MSIESPAYEVIRQDGKLELRRYQPHLLATVLVDAQSYNDATNRGFTALADYIFGNNTASGTIPMTAPVTAGRTPGEKIAMTAPVTSERIEMTAPVTSALQRGAHLDEEAPLCTVRCPGEYAVSFTMPSRYRRLEDLPLPNSPQVKLEEVPSHLSAVARFGGYLNDERVAEAVDELDAWMGSQGLKKAGDPVAAQYDAPWKPGFARHNEVLIDVEAQS